MGAPWKRAIVIGASSGIGEAIARRLVRDGSDVALVARRVEAMERIVNELKAELGAGRALVFSGDVRDLSRTPALFDEIVGALGGLDLVVYASGIMPDGSAHGYPTDADIAAIETNFTGAIVWLNRTAEYFLRQRFGTIIGIGSIAGERGRGRNPVYNATKAALAVYLESLRNRLRRHNINVLTVKPGFVRTEMLGTRWVFPPAASSSEAADEILAAAVRRRRTIFVPHWWRWIAIVLHLIPAPVMERLPI